MMHLRDARFALMPEQLRMEVVTLVLRRFVHFHLDAVRVGPGILTDSGYHPGHLHARFAGFDCETAVGDFCCDDGLCELADHGELIAEIGVQCLEPRGHADYGCPAAVGDDSPVVDIHHVGRFDEGVIQVLVSGIQRVIDFEGAAAFAERAVNLHIAEEIAGIALGPAAALDENSPPRIFRPRPPNCVDAIASLVVAVPPNSLEAKASGAKSVAGGSAISAHARPSVIVEITRSTRPGQASSAHACAIHGSKRRPTEPTGSRATGASV